MCQIFGIINLKILTNVVGDEMELIINSFVVFAITLIVTKSKVLAGKREFVELRYEAAKVDGQDPGWIHRWFHAIWNCSMCSGFWIAIPICYFYPSYDMFIDVMVVFGVNWLLHCLENLFFYTGETMEKLDKIPTGDIAKELKRLLRNKA